MKHKLLIGSTLVVLHLFDTIAWQVLFDAGKLPSLTRVILFLIILFLFYYRFCFEFLSSGKLYLIIIPILIFVILDFIYVQIFFPIMTKDQYPIFFLALFKIFYFLYLLGLNYLIFKVAVFVKKRMRNGVRSR